MYFKVNSNVMCYCKITNIISENYFIQIAKYLYWNEEMVSFMPPNNNQSNNVMSFTICKITLTWNPFNHTKYVTKQYTLIITTRNISNTHISNVFSLSLLLFVRFQNIWSTDILIISMFVSYPSSILMTGIYCAKVML